MALTRQPAVTIQDILNSRNTTASQPTPLFMKSAANQYPAPTYSGGAGTGNLLGPAVPAAAPAPVATGGGGGAPAAPARIAPSAADTSVESLKKTSEYADYLKQREAASKLFEAGQKTDEARYLKNYNQALLDLGWLSDKGAFDKGELLSSGQRATASGKAYNALRNDFAARGMLQSGAFDVANTLLENQLGQQRTSQEEAKTNFTNDLIAKKDAFNAEQNKSELTALDRAKQALYDQYAAAQLAYNSGA